MCIRGDLDPDPLSLEKFSPTVNTMNLAVMLQTAANKDMTAMTRYTEKLDRCISNSPQKA